MQRTMVDGCQKGSSRAPIQKIDAILFNTLYYHFYQVFASLSLVSDFCVLRRVVACAGYQHT
jgi:hypothetical protein